MKERATGSFVMGNYAKVAAARYGDREAFYCVTTGKHLTYREFNLRCNALGNGLLSLGVKKGDVAAFMTYNRVEIAETYFALAKTGVMGIPLNYRLSAGEIVELVNFGEAETFIFDPSFSDIVGEMREKMSRVKRFICMGDEVPDFAISYEDLMSRSSQDEPDVEVSEEDNQYLNLTSGTTGLPKAYLLTHYNNAVAGPVMASMHDVTSDDTILTFSPCSEGGICLGRYRPLCGGAKCDSPVRSCQDTGGDRAGKDNHIQLGTHNGQFYSRHPRP